jgi:hypothetical protein
MHQKGKKEKTKCSYCNRGFHPKSSFMKKTIDLMAQTLEQHHLKDCILDNARKNSSSQKGIGHALLAISSSLDAWVIDSKATLHMASSDRLLSYLETCSRPSIFMGDDSLAEVCGRDRVNLDHGCFQDVLDVLNFSMNLLSIYQTTHLVLGKKVEFIPDSVIIFDSLDGSKIVVGEVNHHSRLYAFSHFTHKSDYVSILTHANEESKLWHEMFGHLNFKYLYQLSKGVMVDGLPHIQYTYGVCQGFILGKHHEEKFNTCKAWRASSLL